MIAPLLLFLQAATGVPAATKDVVVTARSLAETGRAWRACIARDCPADQEIATALAHAEVQFVAGDYGDARITLNKTIGRVKGQAKAFPVPVGDIWRARGRISAHLGEADQFRLSMIASADALKAGLGRDDGRVIAQRIEAADASARVGRLHEALYAYDDAADQARKLDLPWLEGHALFRKATLWTAVALNAPGREPDARRAIARLRDAGPRLAAFRQAGEVLAAYLASRRGDTASLDRLIERMRGNAGAKPMLVFAPTVDPNSIAAQPVRIQTGTGAIATSQFDGQWIDIGFWIGKDGKVSSADVLRESEKLDRRWIDPVLAAVRGRRYAPSAQADAGPGLFRVERVTRTSSYFTPTGTRIRTRDGQPRLVFTDLTDDVADAPS